jgi:hypothetical protein
MKEKFGENLTKFEKCENMEKFETPVGGVEAKRYRYEDKKMPL